MLAGLGTVLATPRPPADRRTQSPSALDSPLSGVENRQFSGGNFLAVAHADHYIDNELKICLA